MRVLKILGGASMVFSSILIGIVGFNYPTQFHPVITFWDMATYLSLIVVAIAVFGKGGNLILDGIGFLVREDEEKEITDIGL